jgi:Uma2 family endonuclease
VKNRERITAADFEALVTLPENADKRLEFISGEIFEVVSNDNASAIAQIITGLLFIYLRGNDIGWLTGPDAGFIVVGECYIPDVAFLTYENHPTRLGVAYRPNPPDLAVEVVSSERSDENRKLNIKVTNYLLAGTVVWVVRPELQHVEVHAPGQPVTVYGIGDAVPGGTLLPDFTLPVRELFK